MGWREEAQFVSPWQEKMCLTEKWREGAIMLLNKVWKGSYILLWKCISGFFTFQLMFMVALVTSLYVGMEKSVFLGHISAMVLMTALMDPMNTFVVNCFYFFMILYLHFINKPAAHCTVQFSLEHHTMAVIPLYFRSLYCLSL